MISSEIMGHVGPVPPPGDFFNRLLTRSRDGCATQRKRPARGFWQGPSSILGASVKMRARIKKMLGTCLTAGA